MLVLLMGLAFWNDLSRHWSRFVDWLRQRPGSERGRARRCCSRSRPRRARPASRCCAATSSLARARCAPSGRPPRRCCPAIDALLARARASRSPTSTPSRSRSGPAPSRACASALATLKGLAFGSARPVVAVPTLAALALRAPRGRRARWSPRSTRAAARSTPRPSTATGDAPRRGLPEGVLRAPASSRARCRARVPRSSATASPSSRTPLRAALGARLRACRRRACRPRAARGRPARRARCCARARGVDAGDARAALRAPRRGRGAAHRALERARGRSRRA